MSYIYIYIYIAWWRYLKVSDDAILPWIYVAEASPSSRGWSRGASVLCWYTTACFEHVWATTFYSVISVVIYSDSLNGQIYNQRLDATTILAHCFVSLFATRLDRSKVTNFQSLPVSKSPCPEWLEELHPPGVLKWGGQTHHAWWLVLRRWTSQDERRRPAGLALLGDLMTCRWFMFFVFHAQTIPNPPKPRIPGQEATMTRMPLLQQWPECHRFLSRKCWFLAPNTVYQTLIKSRFGHWPFWVAMSPTPKVMVRVLRSDQSCWFCQGSEGADPLEIGWMTNLQGRKHAKNW